MRLSALQGARGRKPRLGRYAPRGIGGAPPRAPHAIDRKRGLGKGPPNLTELLGRVLTEAAGGGGGEGVEDGLRRPPRLGKRRGERRDGRGREVEDTRLPQ